MSAEDFYKQKYVNFTSFMKAETKKNKTLAKLIGPYMNLSFDQFTVGMVKTLILPNKNNLDQIMLDIAIKNTINLSSIDSVVLDKFKRYLLCFCSIYEE
jgi:hypothetical protein